MLFTFLPANMQVQFQIWESSWVISYFSQQKLNLQVNSLLSIICENSQSTSWLGHTTLKIFLFGKILEK